MSTIYVTCKVHEPYSTDLTAASFSFKYSERTVEGLISGIPSVSATEPSGDLHEEFRRLGEALLGAAQSPQGISLTPSLARNGKPIKPYRALSSGNHIFGPF
jgi:hypothetical protein